MNTFVAKIGGEFMTMEEFVEVHTPLDYYQRQIKKLFSSNKVEISPESKLKA